MSSLDISFLVALVALFPAVLLPFRRNSARDGLFWGVLGVALLGPLALTARLLAESWSTGLSADLWVVITAILAFFCLLAGVEKHAWRLTPLLAPYLALLGVVASLFASTAERPLSEAAQGAWLDLHIVVSVSTIALLTLAAVAALASFLQARALKLKKPSRLTRMLPPVADSERLSERLLALSELVLGLGLATGSALQYLESGSLLKVDHKSLLSLLAFLVIGALLIGRRICGVRGQIAARVILSAYLLVILGYFGVKFVQQVLLS